MSSAVVDAALPAAPSAAAEAAVAAAAPPPVAPLALAVDAAPAFAFLHSLAAISSAVGFADAALPAAPSAAAAAAVAAAATPPVSATLGEPLDVPPAVALGGAERSPPLLVMQGTSRVWVRAGLRHHGTTVRACTASSDDARMREHVGGKVGACATGAEHRLNPRSGTTAIAAGASRGPRKALVR